MSSERPLAGKISLVTGGSRGIGLAVARRLAILGCDLAVCARHPAGLESAARELEPYGVRVFTSCADVSRANDVNSFVQSTRQALGEIDFVVNNAGIGLFLPGYQATEEQWDTVLDTNLKSVFLVCRAVSPEMIRRKTGHIINISSLAGKNAFAGGSIYCASKWGLMGFTQSLAEDLRVHNIRVSAICPGTVATEFSPHSGRDPSKMLQADDIAHAVETIVTQSPHSFISEILLRPTQKP
ncbi:MAG TPA: SDR family NAD(P)-dependent oxidoreductase [Verrucomicrobiae bacterium]|nr:SDR family NAD(P)-dependent oxidoreductase [Verrucomicrobiae bacterium]